MYKFQAVIYTVTSTSPSGISQERELIQIDIETFVPNSSQEQKILVVNLDFLQPAMTPDWKEMSAHRNFLSYQSCCRSDWMEYIQLLDFIIQIFKANSTFLRRSISELIFDYKLTHGIYN